MDRFDIKFGPLGNRFDENKRASPNCKNTQFITSIPFTAETQPEFCVHHEVCFLLISKLNELRFYLREF